MTGPHNFCESCGAKLLPDARFCEACGHPVARATADAAPPSPPGVSEASPSVACPGCGGPGEPVRAAVDRLKAVPEKDKPTNEEIEAYFDREAVLQSLSVPEEPKVFSLTLWIVLLFIPGINVLSIFFSPLKKGLKIFVSLLAVVFVGFIVWAVTGTFDDPFAPQDTTMAVGATTFGIYLLALVYSWFGRKSEVKNTLWPRWQRSLERWKHLVYCEPCGLVFFDDAPGRSAKVEDTADFLAG